jgi:hypothetical protein
VGSNVPDSSISRVPGLQSEGSGMRAGLQPQERTRGRDLDVARRDRARTGGGELRPQLVIDRLGGDEAEFGDADDEPIGPAGADRHRHLGDPPRHRHAIDVTLVLGLELFVEVVPRQHIATIR